MKEAVFVFDNIVSLDVIMQKASHINFNISHFTISADDLYLSKYHLIAR